MGRVLLPRGSSSTMMMLTVCCAPKNKHKWPVWGHEQSSSFWGARMGSPCNQRWGRKEGRWGESLRVLRHWETRGSRVRESYANRRCTSRARVDDEILKAYDYTCTRVREWRRECWERQQRCRAQGTCALNSERGKTVLWGNSIVLL